MPKPVPFPKAARYLYLNGYEEVQLAEPGMRLFHKVRGRPDEAIVLRLNDQGMIEFEDWERIKRIITDLLDDTST